MALHTVTTAVQSTWDKLVGVQHDDADLTSKFGALVIKPKPHGKD